MNNSIRVVMGSIERRGPWTVPQELDVRVVLGSVELDLRHAQLGPGVTTIDVSITLGSVEIIVPRELAIDVGVGTLASSVETPARPTANVEPDPNQPVDVLNEAVLDELSPFAASMIGGAPTQDGPPRLRIIGAATLGSCEIRRG